MGGSSEDMGVTEEASKNGSVHPPAQGAPDPREASVKSFIGKLVKAAKDLGFYPKGNPAVQAAMRQCEQSQDEIIGNNGALTLIISKDQFYLEDRPLFPLVGPERTLAAELFGLGVRRISFTGETGAADFEQFTSLLLEARDEPVLFKAMFGGAQEQRIRGIEVDQISDLEVVDEASLAEEIDLALDRAEHDDGSFVETEQVVEDVYVRILPERLDREQITKLIENPTRMKLAFSRLARVRQEGDAGTVATEVAGRVLDNITSTIADAPLRDQGQLFRTAAELLLDIEEPLRTRLLFEKVLPNVAGGSHQSGLVRSLTDEELVELMTTALPLHHGLMGVLTTSFRELGFSLPRRESILNLIKDSVAREGAESEHYIELFDALSDSAGVDKSPDDTDDAKELDMRELIPSGECLQLTSEERERIDETLQSSAMTPDIENVPAMLDLLSLEEDAGRLRGLLGALENVRSDALNRGELEVALTVVQGCALSEGDCEADSQKRQVIEAACETAASVETITLLAQMAHDFGRDSAEYALILEYLRTLIEPAYYVLLERLENEHDRTLRLTIRGLLIALGKVHVEALRSRVLHKRWFVARNVASILGEIGGENAVQALAEAARHEEPRVRREALNALGKTGGTGAALAIAGALDDTDNDVALCAARWLTTLEGASPLDGLFGIIQSARFNRLDPDTVMSAIQTIGRRDDARAVGFLKQLARKRISSLFGSKRRIAACAAKALREKSG
jgi:HEAT repeat protein